MVGASLVAMSKLGLDLRLHEATLDDAITMADLATEYDPDDPRDPVMMRFNMESAPADERVTRRLATHNGSTIGYLAAGHEPWSDRAKRYGWVRAVLPPREWTGSRFLQLIEAAEDWQREEGTEVSLCRLRASSKKEIALLEGHGYNEQRRGRIWELDLVANRTRLAAAADASRVQMAELGITMLTAAEDPDPQLMPKLYELTTASEQDIPTTVPIRVLPFDEWRRMWFGDPSIRLERVWLARQGDDVIGISMIGFPPQRGVPWTSYTGTARSVRGRGVARALKHQSVVQAIDFGATRIRTMNDSQNAPILHLNTEMGYRPIDPNVELHRDLHQ
jgi:GNAT superfamily N-acetyltransferase